MCVMSMTHACVLNPKLLHFRRNRYFDQRHTGNVHDELHGWIWSSAGSTARMLQASTPIWHWKPDNPTVPVCLRSLANQTGVSMSNASCFGESIHMTWCTIHQVFCPFTREAFLHLHDAAALPNFAIKLNMQAPARQPKAVNLWGQPLTLVAPHRLSCSD